MRREHETKTTPSGDELIFYCDCNNNVIDRVSEVNLTQIYGSTGLTYTLDPSDNSKYCVKYSLGNGLCPVVIGNYNSQTLDATCMFVPSVTGIYTEQTKNLLASPTKGNHRVEFYWYCIGTHNGSIFDSSGLGNNNSNSLSSGISLIQVNNTIVVRARNNSTSNLDTSVGSVSSLRNKWYRCVFDYIYNSASSYTCNFAIYNDQDNIIVNNSRTLNLPMSYGGGSGIQWGRSGYIFLSDAAGSSPKWAYSNDYIKEVKVWKLAQ